MDENIVFLTICAFLLAVFITSVVLALKGRSPAKYLLWAWAAFLLVMLPFTAKVNAISGLSAGWMLSFFLYVLILGKMHGTVRLEVSHEETRRVLAESNRRIDEERRTISRRLHDDVNPSLVLCKNELKRLESLVWEDPKGRMILVSVQELLADAYSQIRDIIRNTRIEVIDSVGFTAAIESLIAHYTIFFDKPAIALAHNLPKRPALEDEVAVVAYKIIREAVFNAIKHANAKQISVSLTLSDRMRVIEVVVTDDGVGLGPKARMPGESVAGIGLIDMRERARVIGGTLLIQPAFPENARRPGTRVSFSFSTLSSSARNESQAW